MTKTDATKTEPVQEPSEISAIEALRAELAELRSTPEGASAEMQKALAALAAEVEAMKSGAGKVPVPEQTNPDPFDYWARLGNGDVIEVQNPHATHHHTESHGLVPVETVWAKDPDFAA